MRSLMADNSRTLWNNRDALWRPGPPATITRELGQIRKEAAAASDLCAGMWLGLHPTLYC